MSLTEHDKWKQFWDEQAKVTDLHQAVRGDKVFSDEVQSFHDRQLLALLDPQPEDDVLDAGCGVGDQILLVGPHVKRVTAIDFSPVMVERCRERIGSILDNVSVEVADVTSLPFPDNSFDRAVSIAVLQYLNPEEVEAAISEIKRVLKPGGACVFHIKDMASPTGLMITFGRFLRALTKGRPPLEYQYRTYRWYKKKMNRYGKITGSYAYGMWTPFMPTRLISSIASLEVKCRRHTNLFPLGKEYYIKIGFNG
jgi:ubiquinone/menaquinone biosynthesis C-methylase UbiE